MDRSERSMRQTGSAARSSLAAYAVGLAMALTVGPGGPRAADALPAGKSWSAVIDTLKLQGHTYGIVPRRLEPDTLGRPLAFVEAQGGIGQDMHVLRWEDSTWRSVAHLGYGTKGVRPVPSPAGTHRLVWSGLEELEPGSRSYLVMSEFARSPTFTPQATPTVGPPAPFDGGPSSGTTATYACSIPTGPVRGSRSQSRKVGAMRE